MKKKILIYTLMLFLVITFTFSFMKKSYSIDYDIKITGERGKRVLSFYDSDTGYKYSYDTLINSFGMEEYFEVPDGNEIIYFYKGSEISEDAYLKGKAASDADNNALAYGNSAYRVHSTEEAINAIKDIYNNQKYGFHALFFSEYENINWNDVKKYYDNTYSVPYTRKNYYKFSQKGFQEIVRWGLKLDSLEEGYLEIDSTNIRITGDELKITEEFTKKLLTVINKGSDYDKIAAAYTYISNTTKYNTLSTVNNKIASITSPYDALIDHQTTCVASAITFSYLMEKMGIESYIVDDITKVDDQTHSSESTHTFNVVKLNGKFYRIDVGGNFLGAVTSGTLSDNELNVSNVKYGNNTLPQLDYSLIKKYENEAKSIKTTTTQPINLTSTTRKSKEFSIPTNKKTTTKSSKTTKKSNTITTKNNTQVIEEGGTTRIIVVSTTTSKGDSGGESTKDKKINLNYVLFPLLFIVIGIYIFYKIYNKKKGNI